MMTQTIYITPKAKEILDTYIDIVESEVSGLGKVKVENGRIVVTDIYLLRQECDGVSTELNQEDVAKFLEEMVIKGEDTSDLKLWWHSHANMNVFWSVDDDDCIERFQNGWMVSIVGNKVGEYLARFDLYNPVRFAEEKIELVVDWSTNENKRKKLEKEVKEKVIIKESPERRVDNFSSGQDILPNMRLQSEEDSVEEEVGYVEDSEEDSYQDAEFNIDGIDVFDIYATLNTKEWDSLVKKVKKEREE
jgi:hypothetical protein